MRNFAKFAKNIIKKGKKDLYAKNAKIVIQILNKTISTASFVKPAMREKKRITYFANNAKGA
jgi:hypothetical protein